MTVSTKYIKVVLSIVTMFVYGVCLAHDPKAESEKWWWDDAWWERGQIPNTKNYKVKTSWIKYKNGDHVVNAMVVRPKKPGRYPGVLFSHGRRGLDELIQQKVKRLAARGLIVLAPDLYGSRFVDAYPYEHDYTLEGDLNKGVDATLKLKGLSNKRKICLVSHTRGGYYALKVAVTSKRQDKDVACYVSWYPHMQDPNAPEPAQVYGYAPEADNLEIPTLIFIGENEQYQRRRPIESAIKHLKSLKRNAQLIVYPGVGRGFDFRPENIRNFADDLAAKDANRRAAEFVYRHLD